MIQRIYKKLCKIKAKKIVHHIRNHVEGSVLDVGSGRGYIAERLNRRLGNPVHCLDIADLNLSKLPLTTYDGTTIPFPDNSFDTILICYVLHHSEDPDKLLRECMRVSRKRIIIFEDNSDNLLTRPLDIIYNKLHGVATPLTFRNVPGWVKTFRRMGLNVTKVERNVEKEWFYPFVEHIMFVVDKPQTS